LQRLQQNVNAEHDERDAAECDNPDVTPSDGVHVVPGMSETFLAHRDLFVAVACRVLAALAFR
jgi:hypothetical protein